MGLAAGILGAAVIGGVAQSVSAGKAASAQKQAAQQATDTQKQFYGESKAELQPFITGGTNAYGTLNNLLGVGGNSDTMKATLEGIPGYQFTRDQGLKATQSGYAARGLADSGGALKGAANYATGLADSTVGTYINSLQNSASTGSNAASALAGYGTATGQGIGNNLIGAGNARAAAYNTTGSAIAGAAGNVGQYYTLASLLGRSQSASNPNSSTPYNLGSDWTGVDMG
jgi:type II secretory pathway pseudopilin PulG